MVDRIWLIPLLPLVGALLMLFAGQRLPKAAVSVICTGSVLSAFVLSLAAVVNLQADYEVVLFEWLPLVRADWGYLLDPLSAVMLLVVTGIGSLIHIYATGYMSHEEGYYRFFGYLNLFVFFMLLLVLANNYALMFVGWEGVGLSSYLLIGFYFRKKSAGDAAKKAILVNRIGDASLVLGMLLLFQTVGSLRFTEVTAALRQQQVETAFGTFSLIALLLFIGAAGKSAQFPLHVWLPDAMEGPTPVSALIHAATMVTAGVYIVARSNALFHLAPQVLALIAITGAFTAILGASIAMAQNDIKRVLAYSTVSQLGFMFMALGMGAYWVAVFQLVTHAFFKALLFLGAGSVIHALHGEQDMRKMGGLRKQLPVTWATMWAGAAAIAGIPFFAGFYSKEEILLNSYDWPPIFVVGVITAAMTAYYVTRLMWLTFHGEPHTQVQAHESPVVMTGPLVVLALGAFASGFPAHAFESYLSRTLPSEKAADLSSTNVVMALAVSAAAAGILLGRHSLHGRAAKILQTRFYIDETYDLLFVRGVAMGGGRLLHRFDEIVVDGLVNGAAWMTRVNSRALMFWDTYIIDGIVRLSSSTVYVSSYPARLLQTGQLQTYALVIVFGALLVFGVYFTQS